MDEEQREVLALYGLAMYHSQCVEKSTAILVGTLANPDFLNALPEQNRQSLEGDLLKTLGRLIRVLSSRVQLPADLEVRLREALRVRNWLAHRYFWDRAGSVLTHEGRQRMVAELKEASDLLNRLDDELMLIATAWRRSVGISDEVVEPELQKYLRCEDS